MSPPGPSPAQRWAWLLPGSFQAPTAGPEWAWPALGAWSCWGVALMVGGAVGGDWAGEVSEEEPEWARTAEGRGLRGVSEGLWAWLEIIGRGLYGAWSGVGVARTGQRPLRCCCWGKVAGAVAGADRGSRIADSGSRGSDRGPDPPGAAAGERGAAGHGASGGVRREAGVGVRPDGRRMRSRGAVPCGALSLALGALLGAGKARGREEDPGPGWDRVRGDANPQSPPIRGAACLRDGTSWIPPIRVRAHRAPRSSPPGRQRDDLGVPCALFAGSIARKVLGGTAWAFPSFFPLRRSHPEPRRRLLPPGWFGGAQGDRAGVPGAAWIALRLRLSIP